MTIHQSTIATTPPDRHLTASMVVSNGAGDVLLIHHKKSGFWQFPGGHVDPNEAPHETAVREVREETGISAIILNNSGLPGMNVHPTPIEVAEIPAPAKPERPGKPAEPAHFHIDLLYLGHAMDDDPEAELSEVHGAEWVSVNRLIYELHDMKVREDVPVILARHAEKVR